MAMRVKDIVELNAEKAELGTSTPFLRGYFSEDIVEDPDLVERLKQHPDISEWCKAVDLVERPDLIHQAMTRYVNQTKALLEGSGLMTEPGILNHFKSFLIVYGRDDKGIVQFDDPQEVWGLFFVVRLYNVHAFKLM